MSDEGYKVVYEFDAELHRNELKKFQDVEEYVRALFQIERICALKDLEEISKDAEKLIDQIMEALDASRIHDLP